jgi:hypothetical protein
VCALQLFSAKHGQPSATARLRNQVCALQLLGYTGKQQEAVRHERSTPLAQMSGWVVRLTIPPPPPPDGPPPLACMFVFKVTAVSGDEAHEWLLFPVKETF